MDVLLLMHIRNAWAQISQNANALGDAEVRKLAVERARECDELLKRYSPRMPDGSENIFAIAFGQVAR